MKLIDFIEINKKSDEVSEIMAKLNAIQKEMDEHPWLKYHEIVLKEKPETE